MFAVVDLLNRWGDSLTALAGRALWQATVITVIVALVAWALRRASPAVRYWLWQLVAIKLLLLPLGSWSVGLAWLPARESELAPEHAVLSTDQTLQVALKGLPAGRHADLAIPSAAPPSPAPIADSTEEIAAATVTLPPQVAPARPQVVARDAARPAARAPSRTLTAAIAKLHWQAWLLVGWGLLVAVQVMRLIAQRRRLARMLKETLPGSAELLAKVQQIAQQLGMSRTPEVVTTELDCSPFACGIWRPRVVVPASLLDELDAVQLKQVLAHELAHLKRLDLVWGWLTEVARLLYFFHPAMLYAARRVRLERELACDQIAMQLSGRSPAEYAETLVRVLSSAAVSSAFRTAAASLDGGDSMSRGGEGER